MATITTYNLTLKDSSATMWVNSQLDDMGYIDVSLGLYSGDAEVTTSSKVKVLSPKNKAVEAVDSTPVRTFTEEEKSYLCAQIRSMLDRFESANGKEEKAKLAEELLDYLRTTGLEFTKCYERFRKVVVKKCYELKLCNPEFPVVTTKANQLLTTLGETLNVPDSVIEEFYCKSCDKYHHPLVTHTSVVPIQAVAPTTSEFYNAAKTLFLTIAKRLNCPHIIRNPEMYFGFYEKAEKGRLLKRNTVTERMEEYITGWFHNNDGDEGRAKTMKRLFAKHKLTYTEDVMPLYNEWLKSYIIFLGGANRYYKMIRFIELHKHLFSSTF
jgi:hypothetical protein